MPEGGRQPTVTGASFQWRCALTRWEAVTKIVQSFIVAGKPSHALAALALISLPVAGAATVGVTYVAKHVLAK